MNHLISCSHPIMLVDDEADVLSLLKSFLSHEGFQGVVTFADSQQALEYFKNEELALVVADLRMPRLHGKDLLVEFSKLKPYIPVIVVTAESDVETAIECMKSGAIDYLTKPISINRFVDSVKRALELRSLNEDILQLDNATDACTPDIPSTITLDREMLIQLRYAAVVAKSRLFTELLKKIIDRDREPAMGLPEKTHVSDGPEFDGICFSSFPTLRHAESFLIEKALELAKNNQGTAARMLGITRQGLNNRLRRAKTKEAD